MQMPSRRNALVAIAPLAMAAAVASCGGGSKPEYCSDRDTLEQSVKDLGSGNVLQQGGIKDLQAKLQAVETNAGALVGSAKSDFPSETEAIQSSVSTLKVAAQQLPSSPTPQQLATVAKEAKDVVTSFQTFKSASDSNCS